MEGLILENLRIKDDDELISLEKAKLWLENNVYPGFDSMCIGFDRKEDCINQFIKDMQDPIYGCVNVKMDCSWSEE